MLKARNKDGKIVMTVDTDNDTVQAEDSFFNGKKPIRDEKGNIISIHDALRI